MSKQNLPDFIDIGQITRPHGIQGDVRVQPLTNIPNRFERLDRVFLSHDDVNRFPFQITAVKGVQKFIILHLQGIETCDQAESWRNALIQIPRSECLPLPEGQYYYFEIIGLQVITTKGENIGAIVNVESHPAHDVFVVKKDDREYLIPHVAEIVKKVDLENGTVTIDAIEGLIE